MEQGKPPGNGVSPIEFRGVRDSLREQCAYGHAGARGLPQNPMRTMSVGGPDKWMDEGSPYAEESSSSDDSSTGE